MTGVEDVLSEAKTRLEAMTPIPWFEWVVPDSENLPSGTYGVLSVLGPFEARTGRGIISATQDPVDGTLLMEVTARTVQAMNAQTAIAVSALRGWKPTDTSELLTGAARGYEPVTSKFEPTLISRNVLFRFTTGLNRI